MKKFLTLLAMVICVAGMTNRVLAEDNAGLGFGLGDNLKEVKAMLAKNPKWTLKADFSTENDVSYNVKEENFQSIYELKSTPITNTIYSIIHYYSFRCTENDWELVKETYDQTVSKLGKHYESPAKKNEWFEEPYSETNKPIEAIRKHKATFENTYQDQYLITTIELKGLGEASDALYIQTTLVSKEAEKLKEEERHPLKFKKDIYDFGTVIADGSIQTAVFEFENQYGIPVTITGVKCYTGRMTPEYPKEPIPPYGKGQIKVKWRTKYSWGSIRDGKDFSSHVNVEYRFGNTESKEKLRVIAEHLYYPRTVIYDRPIGDLRFSSHKTSTTGWYYKVCGQRNFEMDFAYANLGDKDVKMSIVFIDGATKEKSTIVDNEKVEAHNEYSFIVPVTADGKLKTEDGLLKFYINKKLQATDSVSFILWDEADEATQTSWLKNHPEYKEQGKCKAKSSSNDYYPWWWMDD